eukprot:m.206926 g.206926  ORF g.206926 m.206926 type:complete len:410 (+) comp15800_c0_seq10:241-1470(+)
MEPPQFVEWVVADERVPQANTVIPKQRQETRTTAKSKSSVHNRDLRSGRAKDGRESEGHQRKPIIISNRDERVTSTCRLDNLCPADKRRVGRLITELSTVSNEKKELEAKMATMEDAHLKEIKKWKDMYNALLEDKNALCGLVEKLEGVVSSQKVKLSDFEAKEKKNTNKEEKQYDGKGDAENTICSVDSLSKPKSNVWIEGVKYEAVETPEKTPPRSDMSPSVSNDVEVGDSPTKQMKGTQTEVNSKENACFMEKEVQTIPKIATADGELKREALLYDEQNLDGFHHEYNMSPFRQHPEILEEQKILEEISQMESLVCYSSNHIHRLISLQAPSDPSSSKYCTIHNYFLENIWFTKGPCISPAYSTLTCVQVFSKHRLRRMCHNRGSAINMPVLIPPMMATIQNIMSM